MLIFPTKDMLLAPILPEGVEGRPIAGVHGLDRFAKGIPVSSARQTILATALEGADEETLLCALQGGIRAILLDNPFAWTDLERLAIRLGVAEIRLGLIEGSTKILPLARTPRFMLALAQGAFCDNPRLMGMGIDGASLAVSLGQPPSGGSALVFVQGALLLACAALNVPAFAFFRQRPLQSALVQLKAEGFSWLLAPEGGS